MPKSVWNKIWKNYDFDTYIVSTEVLKTTPSYKRIKRIILDRFGSFKGLRIIEIGAGSGKHSFLFGMEGAKVVIFDYSEESIKFTQRIFKKFGIDAEFILGDALKIEQYVETNKYDISMSFGLAEHFKGEDREKIVHSHFYPLKKGGITIISVPNSWCFPYRVYKFLAEITGKWDVGEEYPFSKKELINQIEKKGKLIEIFGTPFYHDFRTNMYRALKLIPFIQDIIIQHSNKKKQRFLKGERNLYHKHRTSFLMIIWT